jgi:hypothetical protein
MKTETITRNDIDELLRFLPLLSKPDETLEPKWHGLDETPSKDGVFTMPYPTYPPIVEEFFRLAAQPCWCDYGYKPELAGKMVHSEETIASASLADIKTMLTFCVRGERFCDGHRGAMIREGRIGAILRRLEQIRESVQ